MPAKIDMAKFAKFCKDNGFIFQSSEIYGGINGFWDYGPLGVELKNNIKQAWWTDMVRNPPPGPDGQEIRMVGLDCSIIMNPNVWVASGHAAGFADPMMDCSECHKRFRADKVWQVAYFDDGVTNASLDAIMPKDEELSPEARLKRLGVALQFAEQIQPRNLEAVEADNASDAKLHTLRKDFRRGFVGEPRQVVYPATEERYGRRPPCPSCQKGTLGTPRAFNLMFESHAGAIQSEENKVYLRPETAQGIFANYRNVLNSTRLKLPFGVAQIGKAFRNEINPRNFIFRSREFEQMEIEFFCHPGESMKWYQYWRDLRKAWYSTLGIQSANLIPREQGSEELAHYSIGTTDIEYMFPFSDEPQELEGVAHRGAFDLTAHAKLSGKADDLAYFDEEQWNTDGQTGAVPTRSFKEWLKSNPSAADIAKYKFVPHVIEPSAGADRFVLAVLCEAYHEDKVPDAKGNLEERIVMRFHPRLAPIKAAIFPLVNKDGMPEKAMALYRELKPLMNVFFDDKGAVGRRYRRQDEIGTPFCITVDGDTVSGDVVTIRDRDVIGPDGKPQQRKVNIKDVKAELLKAITPGG